MMLASTISAVRNDAQPRRPKPAKTPTAHEHHTVAPVPLEEEAPSRTGKKSPWTAEATGFNVHAGVTVRAGDHEGRRAERDERVGVGARRMLTQLALVADHRAEDDGGDEADGLLHVQVGKVFHSRPSVVAPRC